MFVMSRFVLSRFYSIHFTVTLGGHRISFVISRTSLNRGLLNRGSTVLVCNCYHLFTYVFSCFFVGQDLGRVI